MKTATFIGPRPGLSWCVLVTVSGVKNTTYETPRSLCDFNGFNFARMVLIFGRNLWLN